MHNHPFKRLSAILLAAIIAIGSLSFNIFADELVAVSNNGVSVLQARKADANDFELAKYGSERDAIRAEKELYSDSDTVTVIIQFKDPSVLELYTDGAAVVSLDKELLDSPISDFVNSEYADSVSASILSKQNDVFSQISAMAGGNSGISVMSVQNGGSGVELIANLTKVVNAMTVKMPYGLLEEVRKLPSVKRAYVEQTYTLPVEPASDEMYAGTATYSYNLINVASAWEEGYTGKGTVVAILDTGLDLQYSSYWDPEVSDNVTKIRHTHEAFTENSFKSDDPGTFIRFNEVSMADLLDNSRDALIASMARPNTEYAMYKNLKVPFAFDYADLDLNVFPGFANTANGSDHGTHVAGTIAGYVETEEGEVKFAGVAPDAQIFAMKVATDEGSITSSALLYALNDSLVLGADVINLSLGSDNGFSFDDSMMPEIYAELEEAGIIVMVASGNSGSSISSALQTDYGIYDGNDAYSYAENPDISMMSSPAVYDSSLAVASINSTVTSGYFMKWSDGAEVYDLMYTDANLGNSLAVTNFFGDGKWKFVDCGYGTYDDFNKIGFDRGYGDVGVTAIALVKRGGTDSSGEPISFASKISNASQFRGTRWNSSYTESSPCGCVMLLVYDNVDSDTLINMAQPDYGGYIPNAFISKKDGEAILASLETASLTSVEASPRIVDWEYSAGSLNNPGEMSSFTSWGASPALELKPEITAPGGNIYSTVFDTANNWDNVVGTYYDYKGGYGMMSGTSMATPHMSGLGAVMKQYVKSALRNTVPVSERSSVAEKLLVSTAVPQFNSDETAYASPRQQGAGLADVAAALSTPAYISVEGKKVGKLELGDDPGWTGNFPFSFSVTNISGSPVTYNPVITLQTAEPVNAGGTWLMGENDMILSKQMLPAVVVPAGETVTVDGVISVPADKIAELKAIFTNGIYAEGFIRLTDANGSAPDIGLPFLGYLGDWTEPPIFDSATWLNFTDEEGNPTENYNNAMWNVSSVAYFDGWSFYDLGGNPYANGQSHYYEKNIYIAPGTGVIQGINDLNIYQLRDAKLVVLSAMDKETGEYYEATGFSCIPKTVVQATSSGYYPYPMLINLDYGWYGMKVVYDEEGTPVVDENGNIVYEYLPDGTEVEFKIHAFTDGEYPMVYDPYYGYTVIDYNSIYLDDPSTWPTFNGHEMNNEGDIISFDVTIDLSAPQLQDGAVTVYTDENGRMIMKGTFTDAGSLATVQIMPMVARTSPYDPGKPEIEADHNSPFLAEFFFDPELQAYTFEADITEYVHVSSNPYDYYNYEWTGDVVLACGDYAGNETVYEVTVTDDIDEPGELMLVTTSAIISVGDTFALNVIDNTGVEGEFSRVSSAPEIASVDANGIVTGVAPGTAVITTSKAGKSATCIVTVRSVINAITSFEMPVDHYSTLPQNTYLEVKLNDIQPYDMAVDPNQVRFEFVGAEFNDSNVWVYPAGSGEVGFNIYRYSSDPTNFQIYFLTQGDVEVGTTGTATFRLWIGDIYRDMLIDWVVSEDYLTAANYTSVVKYVKITENTPLSVSYSERSLHEAFDVMLYTAEGAQDYGYNNPTTPATGLRLEGVPFCYSNTVWTGRIVNDADYALPQSVIVSYTSYGAEYYKPDYTYKYDPVTGELSIETGYLYGGNTLVIRADGVPSPGNPAGEYTEVTGTRPDNYYGPFNWSITGGIEAASLDAPAFGIMPMAYGDTVADNEWATLTETDEGVTFYPKKVGTVFVTATSRVDPTKSLTFAVVVSGISADTDRLTAVMLGETPEEDQNLFENSRIVLDEGEARSVKLSFAEGIDDTAYDDLFWSCYDPDIAYIEGDMTSNTLYAVKGGATIITLARKSDGAIVLQLEVYVNGPDITISGEDGDFYLGEVRDVVLTELDSHLYPVIITCSDEVYTELVWNSTDAETVEVLAGDEVLPGSDETLSQHTLYLSAKQPGESTVTVERNGDALLTLNVTVLPHEHVYGGEYEHDESSHWNHCTVCGEQSAKEAHNFVNGVCGVCGYVQPQQPTPPPAHYHSLVTFYNEEYHWTACSGCGLRMSYGRHEYVNGVCVFCGFLEPATIPGVSGSNTENVVDVVEVETPVEGRVHTATDETVR